MRMGLFGFKRKLADFKNVLLVQCSLGGERTNQNPRFLRFILFIYFFASHYLYFSLSFMFCPRVVLVCLTNPESIPSIYPPREFPRDGSTITWCLSRGTAGHSMFVIWIINRKNYPLQVFSEQTSRITWCVFLMAESRSFNLEVFLDQNVLEFERKSVGSNWLIILVGFPGIIHLIFAMLAKLCKS